MLCNEHETLFFLSSCYPFILVNLWKGLGVESNLKCVFLNMSQIVSVLLVIFHYKSRQNWIDIFIIKNEIFIGRRYRIRVKISNQIHLHRWIFCSVSRRWYQDVFEEGPNSEKEGWRFTRIYKDKGTPRRPEEPITCAGPECGLQKAAQHHSVKNTVLSLSTYNTSSRHLVFRLDSYCLSGDSGPLLERQVKTDCHQYQSLPWRIRQCHAGLGLRKYRASCQNSSSHGREREREMRWDDGWLCMWSEISGRTMVRWYYSVDASR